MELVVTELIVFAAGVFAVTLVRREQQPAALFWVIGIGSMAAAALFGVLAAFGFSFLAPLYELLRQLARSAGVVALVVAALTGVLLVISARHAFAATVTAVALLIVVGGALPGYRMPLPSLLLAALLLLAIAIASWRRRPLAARWLLLGAAGLALAEAAGRGWFGFLPVTPASAENLALAVAVLGFGFTARAGR